MAKLGKWIENVGPDDRIVDVAEKTLSMRLEAVEYFLPLAAEIAAESVEYVHQLRVSTRRVRAALSLYDELLPSKQTRRINKDLKRIRQAAGEARDCDVLIARLESGNSEAGEDSKTQRILRRLKRQRDSAQEPIIEIFERLTYHQRFHRRCNKLLARIRPRGVSRQRKLGNPKFSNWAPTAFAPIVEQFLQDVPGDDYTLEELHQFRIRGKGLRYAMELLAPAYPAEFREQLYPRLGELQEVLGEVNDHCTAAARFDRYATEASKKMEKNFFRRLMQQEEQFSTEAQQKFSEWWTPEFHQEIEKRLRSFTQ
ncbi:CHAD domain protein [Symmachiella dynata]|uniref:CHAD domain-containing protein n=1 Tax=Symmachiella dynata TaxID=2527995 RepID=UPI0011880FC9|nr:CHAD domain-containing protein [Symmachiella dynata]QDT49388.1 CHAD domain protein [Symmachiella dynata]